MPYAVKADVQVAAGGPARLIEISDFDADGETDDTQIDRAIALADGMIDSYVRKVRATPVTPTPVILRETSAAMAVYYLKSWRGMLTEQDVLLDEQRTKWLESVSKGVIDLGVTPTPTATGSARNTPAATDRPSSKAVSRENLKGFA